MWCVHFKNKFYIFKGTNTFIKRMPVKENLHTIWYLDINNVLITCSCTALLTMLKNCKYLIVASEANDL